MSDIMTHYGGSVMAVAGENCVGIIADHRLGSGYIAVSKKFSRVHEITPRLFVGFSGFLPDAQHLLKRLKTRVTLFNLYERREIEPKEFAHLLSYMLYSHRHRPLYVNPVVAGMGSNGKPYVCRMDSLGCMDETEEFAVAGTAKENLVGMCEILYQPELDSDRLFTMCGQAFLNAVGRDAFSGWGAECVIITPEKRISREFRGRCD